MAAHCVINHWLVDRDSASLIHQESGEQRRLGEYQLKLLLVLIDHAGQILSREELNQLVWERRVIGNNSLPNAIHALRAALEDDGKQQRIIKTLPKKGYILDTEFCQFITRHEDEHAAAPPEDISLPPRAGDESQALLLENKPAHRELTAPAGPEWAVAVTQPTTLRLRVWKTLFASLLIILVLITAMIVHNMRHTKLHFEPVNIEGVSQIRLLHLVYVPARENITPQDIHKLLGDSLRQLNGSLRQRNARMDIYTALRGSTLSLTLNIFTPCAHQQLAMGIAAATTHAEAMRKLIVEETERKLNEMAPCDK
ncbi:transcriptional regulator [Pantoea sp. Mb-10]|uniref:transcriptional regulator n=1 Tax=unclassified Pantoea TaxID=2630326 RepID=UPI001E60B472|nr:MULTISPECIES: transcriptional regulator [unclassified Pantoea]MCE0489858.1 transcriptional regulator [Pantoea sp. Mb-10]MCE0501036.1 transcriptional regulator [Pantoea sp. Pb-8]